ncbi:MAG: hypothetical protein Q7S65_06155 [Nanoarchaeota archaeon]|nr:hypothetical protein [Nanoarchaeota archaeon]
MRALETVAAVATLTAAGFAAYVAREIVLSPIEDAPKELVVELAPYDPRPHMWMMGQDGDGRFMTHLRREGETETFRVYRPSTGFQSVPYDGSPTNLDADVEKLWQLNRGGQEPCFSRAIKVGEMKSDFGDELVPLFWHMYWAPKEQPEPWLSKIMY